MPALEDNKYAEKHPKEFVLDVLADLIKGLSEHQTKEVKEIPVYTKGQKKKQEESEARKKPVKLEEKYLERTGYSTVEEGLLKHGLYRQKLNEWDERFEDDKEVTDTIKEIRELRETCLIVNTAKGSIPTAFGIFMLKSCHGYVEQQHKLKMKSDEDIASKDRKTYRIGYSGGTRENT